MASEISSGFDFRCMPTSRSAAALDRGFAALINLARPLQRRRRPRLGKITQPPPGLVDGALPRPQRNPAPHADFAIGRRARPRLRSPRSTSRGPLSVGAAPALVK